MFLDDRLLQICKQANIKRAGDVQRLNKEICRECEKYYKSKLYYGISKNEVRVILNRTFNLFDSFLRNALKSKDPKLIELGKLFEKYNFKTQFLANEEMRKIYNNLK